MSKNLLLSKKLLKLTASHLSHLEDGMRKAKSKALELLPTLECFVSKILKVFLISIEMKLKNKKSFILESLQINKKMTLPDKLNLSKNNFLPILLFRMLGVELIILERDCKPFWNSQCLINSQKLWLPTKIDLPDLDSNSSNSLLNTMEEKSLFWMKRNINPQNKNLQTTSLISSMSSTAEKWEEGDTVLKTRKVKLNLNNNQRKIINGWFGTCRYVYNRAVSYINNPHTVLPDGDPKAYEVNLSYLENNKIINKFHLRDLLVTKINNEHHINDWEFDTPKDIRADTLKTLVANYESAFTNLKRGNICKFGMNYKTKKSITKTIDIPKSAIKIKDNKLYIYSSYIKDPIKIKQNIKKLKINHDSELHYNGLYYYLLIPIDSKVEEKKEEKKIIALDPGEKRFQVGYSNKECIEISSRTELTQKLKKKIKDMQSRFVKLTSKIKRQIRKKYNKINNIIDDIHWRTITYLRKNYNDILLPIFESQEMVKSMNSYQKKCKDKLLTLKHYKFKERLINKAKSIKNLRVHIVNEAYTSKTCTNCGTLNETKPNYMECRSCKITVERDINGSRNILLKHLL
jgi:putative transposase